MTPLQKEILRFVLIISLFITCVVVLIIVLWAAWLRKSHPNWINVPLLIVSCVSAAVACEWFQLSIEQSSANL
jgi:sodium/potassium-transporting ATPase subunit alpha